MKLAPSLRLGVRHPQRARGCGLGDQPIMITLREGPWHSGRDPKRHSVGTPDFAFTRGRLPQFCIVLEPANGAMQRERLLEGIGTCLNDCSGQSIK